MCVRAYVRACALALVRVHVIAQLLYIVVTVTITFLYKSGQRDSDIIMP